MVESWLARLRDERRNKPSTRNRWGYLGTILDAYLGFSAGRAPSSPADQFYDVLAAS
jgi:hypothetical protein